MLSEISQRKTNIKWFHLYVKYKKQNNKNKLIEMEIKLMVTRGEDLRG